MQLGEYLGLEAVRRSPKPRTIGITMVMDQGMPTDFTAGMLAQFGDSLDVVKFWDPISIAPLDEVRRKIEVYRQHGVVVQPGGIFLEMARRQKKAREVLPRLADLGFNAIEISSTTSTRGNMDEELGLIRQARDLGLVIFGEVGRKFADGDETRLTETTLDVDRTIAEFKALLAAGATKVYWEGHLLRMVMGDTPESIKASASTGTRQVLEVARAVGTENIIFEVSGLRPRENRQWLQFWLVRLFGPEVNIGNACLEELAHLHALRTGSHPIFGFGSAGNYPRERAIESGTAEWWRG